MSADRCTPPGCACIVVEVPAGAEVWLEGRRSAQTGTQRVFYSPPLPPNGRYAYKIRARWPHGSGRMEQVRDVVVQPGQRVNVQFPLANQTVPAPLPQLLPAPRTTTRQ